VPTPVCGYFPDPWRLSRQFVHETECGIVHIQAYTTSLDASLSQFDLRRLGSELRTVDAFLIEVGRINHNLLDLPITAQFGRSADMMSVG
jgi:hypothetical protein